ncbi:MAG: type II toxin-antitoxin system RelE/ParE family toxin [Solirubrobacterales bacterium]|nr:type II toxin-antitoxin system RelE/ParE family toxin [Solirubrobacterales bacterium]
MPHLPFPHSSQVDGELRELRCHMGSEHYRVLYRRSGRLFILLHAFPKTTGKLPPAEIKIAQKRWRTSRLGWMPNRASRRERQGVTPPRSLSVLLSLLAALLISSILGTVIGESNE